MGKQNRLREILEREGITHKEIADESGVSPKTISRAAVGEKKTRKVTNYKILNTLNNLTGKEYKYGEVFGNNLS